VWDGLSHKTRERLQYIRQNQIMGIDKKAIFVNTASQIMVRFITLAFTLISIKLLTNYLGVSGVGKYNTITTYVNFLLVIADLGLFSVTVREISKNPHNEKQILSNVYIIRLISAFLMCLVAVGIIFFTPYRHDPEMFYGIMIATGFLFFNLMGSVYDIVLQYRLKMQFSATAEFLSKLLTLAALFIIIRLNGGFLWTASTIALMGFLIFVFKWYFGNKFVRLKPQYDKHIALWIFNLSWPIGIVFIVSNLFFRLDTMMLFVIKGATAVGIYSVAYKVLEVTAFIGSYFASALKPTLAENIDHKKEFLSSVMRKSFNIMLLLAMPVTVACAVFAKDIIIFLSNADFVSGSPALVFLAFTLPIIFFDVLLSEILIANDERKLFIRIAVFILIFNFIFNLIFIPLYSFMGAAWGTFVSELVLFVVSLYYTRKIVPFKIDFSGIGKILIVAILTTTIAYILKLSGLYFILSIIISLAVFALLTLIFRIVTKETLKELIIKEKTL